MSKSANNPYQDLGLRLKQLREKLHESVAEVSGAVEIDEDVLVKIEQGERRPSEDVLMLLMSHFNMQEEESVKLWELAGYDKPRPTMPGGLHEHIEEQKPPHLIMVMQSDTRVLYSDMVQVTVNDHGVVLGFMQTAGTGSPSQLVARIGMSKEHARSVSRLIEESLHKVDQPPKLLPGPSDKKRDKKK